MVFDIEQANDPLYSLPSNIELRWPDLNDSGFFSGGHNPTVT